MRTIDRWRRRGARPSGPRGEDGFILLESVIAISLITVVMGALASLTINVVSGSNELRARQGATQLATSAMATIGAVPPTDLRTGRGATSVANQFAAASATVRPWLVAMTPVSDDTPGVPATAGATATIPTAPLPDQVLNGITYSVETYLGACAIQNASVSDCVISGTGPKHLRAVVAVTWTGRGCRVGSCTYVTATLVNATPDPIFNTNRANPPTKPVVADPGAQVSTRGAVISLQLTVDAGTGLAPLAWQVTSGVLPTGLTLAADGLVTGTPTVIASATPLTVTVRDAFGRPATATFTWSVVAPPTITAPPTQSTVRGQAVNLAVTSSCPNTPCSYALADAPAGLSINATTGVITGTPTTVGTSSAVVVTVTDADAVAAKTTAFTWSVTASPPTIGSPGNLNTTVGLTVSVPVAYTCPAGPCTVTLDGTAPGVGLSAATPVNANNTATTLTVSGNGTLYLAGIVQPAAVGSGATNRVYSPTLTIVDAGGATATSAAGSWTVYARPTISSIGTRNVAENSTQDVPLAFTCPRATCTITLTGMVPGLGLRATPGVTVANNTTTLQVTTTTGTVYVTGKVASNAASNGSAQTKGYPLSVTITDTAVPTVSAVSSGTWTATKGASTAPVITNPGDQAAEPNKALSLQVFAACPNGSCDWLVEVQFAGSSSWSTVQVSSTGRLSYPGAPQGKYRVRITVTDAKNLTDSEIFTLTVQDFTLSISDQSTPRGTSETLDVSTQLPPPAAGYTYALAGNPSWLSISADGVLTATPPNRNTATATNITVTATSEISPTSTVTSNRFSWAVQ